MTRARLDAELVRRGLARSRGQARDVLAAGRVRVNGALVDKAALAIAPDDELALEGEADLDIKPGTQPNEIYTIRDKGIKHLRANGTGSLNVGIRVEIPKKLTKEQEEILQQFAKLSGENIKSPSKGKKKLFNF